MVCRIRKPRKSTDFRGPKNPRRFFWNPRGVLAMEQLYSNVPRKVIQSKKQIKNSLNVKLKINGNIIIIDGKIEDELIVHNIIKALDLGFSVNKAL